MFYQLIVINDIKDSVSWHYNSHIHQPSTLSTIIIAIMPPLKSKTPHHCGYQGCKTNKNKCVVHFWSCVGTIQAPHPSQTIRIDARCESDARDNTTGVLARCGRKHGLFSYLSTTSLTWRLIFQWNHNSIWLWVGNGLQRHLPAMLFNLCIFNNMNVFLQDIIQSVPIHLQFGIPRETLEWWSWCNSESCMLLCARLHYPSGQGLNRIVRIQGDRVRGGWSRGVG